MNLIYFFIMVYFKQIKFDDLLSFFWFYDIVRLVFLRLMF